MTRGSDESGWCSCSPLCVLPLGFVSAHCANLNSRRDSVDRFRIQKLGVFLLLVLLLLSSN